MSIASVTVHHTAHSDPRVAYLGELAGYSRREAFGRLVELWGRCTFLQTDKPGDTEICACLGVRGLEVLVACGLGEKADDGVRVRGRYDNVTGRDRFAWFAESPERSERRSIGGRNRASNAPRDARGRMVAGPQLDQAVQQPPATPGTSTSGSDLSDLDRVSDLGSASHPPELPDPVAVVGAERDRDPDPLPEDPPDPLPGSHAKFLASTQVPHDAHAREKRRKLASDAWQYALLMHNQLRITEGIDPHAQSWPGDPGPNYPPFVELRARVDEQIAGFGVEKARERIRTRIDIAAATARRDRTLRWFTPTAMWNAKSFAHDVELSAEQALAPRAGPRLVPNQRPEPERRPSKRLG